jgi:hypothetical protein
VGIAVAGATDAARAAADIILTREGIIPPNVNSYLKLTCILVSLQVLEPLCWEWKLQESFSRA